MIAVDTFADHIPEFWGYLMLGYFFIVLPVRGIVWLVVVIQERRARKRQEAEHV